MFVIVLPVFVPILVLILPIWLRGFVPWFPPVFPAVVLVGLVFWLLGGGSVVAGVAVVTARTVVPTV